MSAGELAALYDRYRRHYFAVAGGYAVPPVQEVTIEWSSRLSASAGVCYPTRRLIRLSTHYHARRPEETGATLLHEMIHLIVPGHGPEFAAWIRHIRAQGGVVHRYSKERAAPARWIYSCPRCGLEFPRHRRLKGRGRLHRCRRCGPDGGPLRERRNLT